MKLVLSSVILMLAVITAAVEVQLQYRRVGQAIGRKTILRCMAYGSSSSAMGMKRNGQPVLDAPPFYTLHLYDSFDSSNLSVFALIILEVREVDFGTYTCYASDNSGHEDSQSLELFEYTEGNSSKIHVEGAPQVQLYHRVLEQEEGKDTALQCLASSKYDSIIWNRHGQPMVPQPTKYEFEDYSAQNESGYNRVMEINGLESQDFTTYTCIAYNDFGEDSITLELREWDRENNWQIKQDGREKEVTSGVTSLRTPSSVSSQRFFVILFIFLLYWHFE